jgi:menaquinone-dependent protoporphyrinogen IX oxidase
MNRKEFFKLGLVGAGSIAFLSKAKALEYYPMASDKKWAIIYSTWCGSSRDAAVWISEGMAGIANVFDIRENPDLSSFEDIVLGGSIRSAQTSAEMQAYIKSNKNELKLKVRGLFAVCGNMGQPVTSLQTTQFINNHLAKLCELNSLPSKVFLGRITKSLMDAETASSMAGSADYDNLKRSECMSFGKQVIDSVVATQSTTFKSAQPFNLGQNYPQPFNQITTIPYELSEDSNVLLSIYTTSGQKVDTLVSEFQKAGHYNVIWDGRNLVAGIYIYKMETGKFSETKEALLVK